MPKAIKCAEMVFSEEVTGIYNLMDFSIEMIWKSAGKKNANYTDAKGFLMADSIKVVADTIEMFVTRY